MSLVVSRAGAAGRGRLPCIFCFWAGGPPLIPRFWFNRGAPFLAVLWQGAGAATTTVALLRISTRAFGIPASCGAGIYSMALGLVRDPG
jgi:hypothetical protein